MASDPLAQQLAASGYAFVRALAIREALESCGPLSDWQAFAASWDHLEIDPYLAERGRYRRRRFAVYAIDGTAAIQRQAHQPHVQGQEYNQLFGGVERWFAPIADEVGDGATMRTILRWCHRLFGGLEALQARDTGADPRISPTAA
jgi:hypothetical protein